MAKPLRWLITGGCGFIGLNLVEALLKEKSADSIRIFDNLSIGKREDLHSICGSVGRSVSETCSGQWSAVELIVGDILDTDKILAATKGADVMVHLAANTGVASSVENPQRDCSTNVLGTVNCLEAARRRHVQRFVFASSGAPVGECDPPIHEELVPHPVSPYGASKLAGEGYCSAYYRTFGIETAALRFGNVYGPYSSHKSSVVAKFIRHAMAGQILEVYGNGKQTRDFIFVKDLVEAIRLAGITPDIGGEVFQIATNKETTVSELVEKLKPLLRNAGMTELRIVHCSPRVGDVFRNYSDTTKAAKLLDWHPRVSLEEGLQQTLRWFLNSIDSFLP